MKTRLVNCEVLDPASGRRFFGMVEWEDGTIRQVRAAAPGTETEAPKDVLQIDGHGHLLTASFVDLYADFCEPGHEEREDIASGSRAAVAGGFTALALRPDTTPPVDGPDAVRLVLDRVRSTGLVDARPLGSLSVGLRGESMAPLGEMADEGVFGFSEADRYLAHGGFLRHCLEYASSLGLPILLTSEDPTLSEGAAHEGFVATIRGLKGSPDAAEEAAVARHVALAERTGVPVHLLKISSAAALRIIRDAKARGLPVTASTTSHHLALNEDSLRDWDPHRKVWPPCRTEEDRLALLMALKDGTLDAIVSDHAPRAIEDKELEFDLAACGAATLELAWPLVHGRVLAGEIDLATALRALAVGPRRILGLPGGAIAEGQPADLVLLDRKTAWTARSGAFRSRGTGCLVEGQELVGHPVLTIRGGRVVFDSKERPSFPN